MLKEIEQIRRVFALEGGLVLRITCNEWYQGHLDHWGSHIDECVWQNRSHSEENNVAQHVIPPLLDLLAKRFHLFRPEGLGKPTANCIGEAVAERRACCADNCEKSFQLQPDIYALRVRE
jgi:hypothetical protein